MGTSQKDIKNITREEYYMDNTPSITSKMPVVESTPSSLPEESYEKKREIEKELKEIDYEKLYGRTKVRRRVIKFDIKQD